MTNTKNTESKKDSTRLTNYHDFTTKDMSVAERRKLDVGDIWLNRIQCKKCGDIITSNNRHDMKYCECGAVFVDGGSWYGKRGAKNLLDIKDLTELFDKLEPTMKEVANESMKALTSKKKGVK